MLPRSSLLAAAVVLGAFLSQGCATQGVWQSPAPGLSKGVVVFHNRMDCVASVRMEASGMVREYVVMPQDFLRVPVAPGRWTFVWRCGASEGRGWVRAPRGTVTHVQLR